MGAVYPNTANSINC